MQTIRLIEITNQGAPSESVRCLPKVAAEACASTASLYQKVGFSRPWIGYLALSGGEVVGTCAFTAPPVRGRVEIAYFTFPPFERRGVAAAMAAQLIAVARAGQPEIEIFAHTLPEDNASGRILTKLAFEFSGQVVHPEDGLVWEWCLSSASKPGRTAADPGP